MFTSSQMKGISHWQSVSMIPVLLLLLKEQLNLLESADHYHRQLIVQCLQKKLQFYLDNYQRWRKADLNPRQSAWMEEIRAHLDSLQNTLF